MSLLDAFLLDPEPVEVWFALRTDGIKGCGTLSDPFDGSTPELFDARMRTLPLGSRIHLGPGVFETRGYPHSDGWQIKAGMKISGSGIDVTTLKLIDVSGGHGYAIGHDLTHAARVDLAEVSDLTVDCNLESPGGFTIHGAIRLMGQHVKIHRVKAIHWGAGAAVGGGCLVFSIVTADQEAAVDLANGGIADCLATERSSNRNTGVIVFQIGGAGITITRESHGKSPYLRHCFVDGGVTSPEAAPGWVTAISASWCRGGVVEGNHVANVDVGVAHSGRSVHDLIVRNNLFTNVAVGVSLKSTMGASIGGGDLGCTAGVATIEGVATESLHVGDRLRLVTTPPDTFSGVYVVRSILGVETFTVATPVTTTGSATVTAAYPVRSVARAIVDGNLIELTQEVSGAAAVAVEDDTGGISDPEEPDHVHGEVIIRHNKVRYVNGVPPDDEEATLITVHGAKHLVVQRNVLDTVADEPIQTLRCGSQTYIDNRMPNGVLMAPPETALDRVVTDFEIPADEALVMACFSGT